MCREESESLFYLQEERMSCGLDRRVSCPYRQTRAPSCTDHPKYHDTSLVPTILNIMIRHWFWKNEKHLVIIRISLCCWLNEKHDLSLVRALQNPRPYLFHHSLCICYILCMLCFKVLAR